MDLKLRSDMNWDSINEDVLAHFKILGQFRSRHPAVGAGTNLEILAKPYIFARTYQNGTYSDRIIAVIADPNQKVEIPVAGIFDSAKTLRNAYDGTTASVTDGKVIFDSGINGVILIETDEK